MAKKRLFDEHGNKVKGKIKKPFYKKIWFWILIAVLVFTFSGGSDDEEAVDKSSTEPVTEKVDKKEKKESKEQEKEPSKEQSEEEAPYKLVDGVALFTDDGDVVMGVKSHVDVFSSEMTAALKKYHNEIKDGAIFRSVNLLDDEYGNQVMLNAIVVYYSQETIDKINFDNWPRLDASGLYETSDSMWVHPAFKVKGAKENKSGVDIAPDVYFNYLGSEYEEE